MMHYFVSLTKWHNVSQRKRKHTKKHAFSGDLKTWSWPQTNTRSGQKARISMAFHMDLCWLPKNSAHWKPTSSRKQVFSRGIYRAHGRCLPPKTIIYLPYKSAKAEVVPGLPIWRTSSPEMKLLFWQAPLFLLFISLATRGWINSQSSLQFSEFIGIPWFLRNRA